MFEFTQGDIIAYLRGNQWLVQNGYMPKYHAVLCDPPYGLEFMGQEWDKPKPSGLMDRRNLDYASCRGDNPKINKYVAGYDFQAWVTEWASLMLDYVYPGAVGMFFGGTRTFHRLACGLEDAGWEVVDCIMYLYGSGFPKSLSVSKSIDKSEGAEREVVGIGLHAARRQSQPYGMGATQDAGINTRVITAPATDAAKQWDGYGTALKPMYEPVILARAPRHPYTFAQLAQQFGSGALNVDGGRIGTDDKSYFVTNIEPTNADGSVYGFKDYSDLHKRGGGHDLGRFPGNVALVHTDTCTPDGCAAGCAIRLLDEMTPDRTSKATGGGDSPSGERHVYDGGWKPIRSELPDDNGGGASRFFYTAKASGVERLYLQDGEWKRVTHPTLKPISLVTWLATLLLPPKLDTPRRLLVPFAGVGSEMIGAHLAGWDVIHGIEQSAAYIAEGKQRAAWWGKYDSYDKAAASYAVLQEVKQEEAARKAANVEQLRLFGEDVA